MISARKESSHKNGVVEMQNTGNYSKLENQEAFSEEATIEQRCE